MRNNEQGFSLIEVMITYLLIGVSVLGLIKLQSYIEQRADFAIHSIEALNLAEQKLEWFRTRGSLSPDASFTVASYDGDIVSGSEQAANFYILTWSVTEPSSLLGCIKMVDIEASWLDRQGNKHAVNLQTMISKFSEFDS
ncbi:type IV pilus modification PilV family protein [Vibrio ziniensis]|uniref:Prepilin-type N-terminal cleavage/methylation domain-containing protein n=1 Tax=Vibrio ziniensis TaxID=2711221 RepID=A0A6G7CGB1_9VIBR|nr:prepilin-type N-terminal cleavage/methylation domain-containing protein [Vibrio ziniensis]QIH41124.1 prepilin-type N-terminal cleavage/methylation domain-containing protein [Vibrio ziniensis]